MTNEEALKRAQEICELYKRKDANGIDWLKAMVEFWGVNTEALEKQIAKKPIHTHHCPNCDYGLPVKGITDVYCECCFGQKYCPECGQKLDWSDEE